MKRIFLTLVCLGVCLHLFAQIRLTPYLPDDLQLKSQSAYNILLNKLNMLISQNGLMSSVTTERFVLTCNCVEVSKTIVPGVPIKHAYVIEVNFHIGDGMTGVKYATVGVKTKGVGNTEDKAYINAIKGLNCKSTQISNFINIGIKRIIEYYEQQRHGIFSSADVCVSSGDYKQAIYLLDQVPSECSYYQEAQERLVTVYDAMINDDSRRMLMEAKGIWTANQDVSSANEAVELLSQISPNASCYNEAQTLIKTIFKGVDKINQRTWEEYTKEQQHRRNMEELNAKAQMQRDIQNAQLRESAIKSATALQMKRVQAARDVAVAYATSRPRIVYHLYRWY